MRFINEILIVTLGFKGIYSRFKRENRLFKMVFLGFAIANVGFPWLFKQQL